MLPISTLYDPSKHLCHFWKTLFWFSFPESTATSVRIAFFLFTLNIFGIASHVVIDKLRFLSTYNNKGNNDTSQTSPSVQHNSSSWFSQMGHLSIVAHSTTLIFLLCRSFHKHPTKCMFHFHTSHCTNQVLG